MGNNPDKLSNLNPIYNLENNEKSSQTCDSNLFSFNREVNEEENKCFSDNHEEIEYPFMNEYFKDILTTEKIQEENDSFLGHKRKVINDAILTKNKQEVECAEQKKKKIIRIDSYIISFKKHLNKFIVDTLNCKIKNTGTKRKIKVYLFNYEDFTQVVTYKKNREWLNLKIKDLLSLHNPENEKSIAEISHRKGELFQLINLDLNKTYSEWLSNFYKSTTFNEYKNDPKTLIYDEFFIHKKGFSLLENDGFIRLINKN